MRADRQTSAKQASRRPSDLLGRLKTALPTRESLAAHAWLKPVAHHVLDPGLWRPRHEAVARGVAIGIFWAFAIPFAQFVVAVAHCVWWRANIPVAAGVTLVTNPLTIGFWLWLAHRLGGWLLDSPPRAFPSGGADVAAWLASLGAPTLLGMGIFSLGGATAGYLVTKLARRAHIAFKRLRRRRRKTSRNGLV